MELKIIFEIESMTEEQQKAFYEMLSNSLTEKEINSIKICVSYIRLLKYPELKNAMMTAIADQLYKEFNKKMEEK